MRTLRRAPGFSLLSIAILGISIGAAAAVLSAFHALRMKPLPFRNAGELAAIDGYRKGTPGQGAGWSDLDDWQRTTNAFQAISGCSPRTYGMALTRTDPVEVLLSCQVTPAFFEVFDAQPLIGRPMRGDDANTRPRAVWLSHRLWQQRFGSDAQITRRTLFLNEEPFVIAGVLPESFRYLDAGRQPDLYFVIDPKDYRAQRGGGALSGVARLRPGVSIEQAQAQLDSAVASLRGAYPEANRDFRAHLLPIQQQWAGAYGKIAPLFLAAVLLLLLIACLNVATLVLARALARMKETALRLAIGASLRQVLRENLREMLAISMAGGVAGLCLAQLLLHALNHAPRYLPELPLLEPVSLNGFVFGCVAIVCTMIAMAFAMLPVAAMRNVDFVAAVRGGAQQTASQRGVRWRRWLVTAQIAASTVLLGNTLLLTRSFHRVLSTDPGFDPHQTLTFGLGIPESRYDTDAKMAAFHAALEDRLKALPQVEAVSGVVGLPMSGGAGRARFLLPGDAETVQRPMRMSIAGTEYLRAMRIPLLAGRNFSLDDRLGKPGVVLINQTMARQYFAGRDPSGERIRISWRTPSYPKGSEFEIIGVVGDTRQGTLEQQILPQVYATTAQLPAEGVVYVIRTAASAETLAPAVRHALASIDPALERIQLRPMTERLDATLRNRRVSLVLLGGFAGLALLLALAGVGSLLSFLAVQRRKEFGLRVALGDSPQGLAALVLRQATALAAIGLILGVPITMTVAQWIRSQLHETSPMEGTVYFAVAFVILAMALFAAAIPAWRAARVDPATILRSDG